ncbi:leukocyte receptor cluster member 1 homolog [Microplitis demolitor]|uniref:leukocyte receptor cluster member 1 homolog n=1 Tax=Microplitis demolitor TaxID=69319 RepID=UPI0004CD28AB|nr:leukocyte receptor cluster member 1 homolog [Microplitis demolitor]
MNILPKKKWHVRTKENIARVRKDEAQAAEEEKARQARAQKAETEARINILRKQARSKYDGRPDEENKVDEPEVKEHINFFKDLEEGRVDHHKPNAEREAEKKAEKEKYEKQIGYLTYLGQNTNESTGSKSWYEELPRRLTDTDVKIEVQGDKKVRHDPMVAMKRYLSTMGSDSKPMTSQVSSSRKRKLSGDDDSERLSKKHKKSKKSKKHKRDKDVEEVKSTRANVDIEKLRAERLMRERAEKLRTEALLAKVRGDPVPVIKVEEEVIQKTNKIKQKYNSQFCPEIARQNLVDTPRR